jgi:hypothetical protein
MITEDNWNYSFYQNGRMQVCLCLIGAPSETGPQVKYGLTLLDEENREYFQRDFIDLSEAVQEINIRYAHWKFTLREEKSDEGGCSSCQAH